MSRSRDYIRALAEIAKITAAEIRALPDTITRTMNLRVECDRLRAELKATTGDQWPLWREVLDQWVSANLNYGHTLLSARHLSTTALLHQAQHGRPVPPPPGTQNDAEWRRLWQGAMNSDNS